RLNIGLSFDDVTSASGSLNIADGGQVEDVDGEVAHGGISTVDGASSKWTHLNTFRVGSGLGDGLLSIINGGLVENLAADAEVYVGGGGGGRGTVNVDGPNSRWISAADLFIASNGSFVESAISITHGGLVQTRSALIAEEPFDRGAVTVSGAGSRWISTGAL